MRRFRHHRLLGTVVDVMTTSRHAESIDATIVAEIRRLEHELSVFDPTSTLERWKVGEVDDPGPDVNAVLTAALDWQARSAGAFNVSTGVLSAMWQRAVRDGVPPDTDELARAAGSIAEPPYRIVDGVARLAGDASGVSLNAFAKGWIVDRAVEAACDLDPDAEVAVSAGGDVRHQGSRPMPVAIENPLRPYDNEPPLTTVQITNTGLASSGRARRGFRIGTRWHAHVVDPRTGRTIDDVAAISVVADDAASADVLATVLSVEEPDRVPLLAASWDVAAMVVAADGRRHESPAWQRLVGNA